MLQLNGDTEWSSRTQLVSIPVARVNSEEFLTALFEKKN